MTGLCYGSASKTSWPEMNKTGRKGRHFRAGDGADDPVGRLIQRRRQFLFARPHRDAREVNFATRLDYACVANAGGTRKRQTQCTSVGGYPSFLDPFLTIYAVLTILSFYNQRRPLKTPENRKYAASILYFVFRLRPIVLLYCTVSPFAFNE